MSVAAQILFWLGVLYVLYAFTVYPLVIMRSAKKRVKMTPYSKRLPPDVWPSVSIIIFVKSKEQDIKRTLTSIKKIDYPTDRVSVTVIMDKAKKGKPAALNKAVAAQKSDYLVFVDPCGRIESSALKRMISLFQVSDDIGVVCAETVPVGSNLSLSKYHPFLRKYESKICKAESRYFTTPSLQSHMYAISRHDFVPLYNEVILEHFEISIAALQWKTKRTVVEQNAVIYDGRHESGREASERKNRWHTGLNQAIRQHDWLMDWKKSFLRWHIAQHHISRRRASYALIIIFISSLLTGIIGYWIAFLAQLMFYTIGFAVAVGASKPGEEKPIGLLSALAKESVELNKATTKNVFDAIFTTIDSWRKMIVNIINGIKKILNESQEKKKEKKKEKEKKPALSPVAYIKNMFD